jgi:hypothetical protein
MSIKKTIARELFWFFVAILIAVPISLLFVWMVELNPEGEQASLAELVLQLDFILLIGLGIGIICVYLIRLMAWSVKNMVAE